ncbi:MAG: glycine betaine ABC transporter substrate-binding protein [Solirubrobacteraceae bacterium]
MQPSGSLIQKNPANASKTVNVGSKDFTEEFILGNIYAQALQAAGYNVKTSFNLGSEQIAYRAVKSGQVDFYPEYTGTILTSFFNVPTAKVPKTAQAAYALSKADLTKSGYTALSLTPFTDSNALGMLTSKAKSLGVTKISQLASKASTLRLDGSPQCRQRLDCLVGLEKVYGLKFKSFTPVDISLLHQVLLNGQADASVVFTTDPQLRTGQETVLQDDKGIFPPDNVTAIVSPKTVAKFGPDFAKVISQVNTGLTTPVMEELNARVSLDKQTPATVAAAYLKESGYVK